LALRRKVLLTLQFLSRLPGTVVPFVDEVAKLGILVTLPGVVVAGEVSVFLTTLAAACPR
jgi:hypothetical protein